MSSLMRARSTAILSVLLVSGGAVMTSDPYRYLMRVNRPA